MVGDFGGIYDEIVAAIQAAADDGMKGIVKVTDEPLVSSDFNTTNFSSTLDVKAGIELNPTFFKRKKFQPENTSELTLLSFQWLFGMTTNSDILCVSSIC